MTKLKSLAPGIGLVLAISLLSELLVKYIPTMGSLVIAILLGILIKNLWGLDTVFQPGKEVTSKQLLELSVALLGLEFNFGYIFQIGPRILILIVLCIGGGIGFSYLLGMKFGLSKNTALLIAIV